MRRRNPGTSGDDASRNRYDARFGEPRAAEYSSELAYVVQPTGPSERLLEEQSAELDLQESCTMIDRASETIVVIGQGYVGLPVAMRAVAVGFNVVGIDADPRKIKALNAGESYVEDIPNAELAAAIASGRFMASADAAACGEFSVAVIAVPTPLDEGMPDLTFMEKAGEFIAPSVTVGCTVVLESTTYPGTTEELLVPILEKGSGLKAGVDFYVGYSPERIDPGNPTWTFINTPKVVSGINAESLKHVDAFYSALVERTVSVSTPKEAELTKLLENTFRHVNVALVNELAVFANQLGIDVWEAIDAASTKPFGFMRFTPGPGVGGHCLPIDPTYLSWQVRRALQRPFRFVELANDVNEQMPAYVVTRIGEILNRQRKAFNGSTVLLIGLAYKKNTGDARESPAIHVADRLLATGAKVQAADGHVLARQIPEGVEHVELSNAVLEAADLVVILTDHDNVDYEHVARTARAVFDTRRRATGERAEVL